MTNLARATILGTTAVGVAVIVMVAFLWVGPGAAAFSTPASAFVLFDEQRVVDIYDTVSPAVVQVSTSVGVESTLERSGTGSGFLIDTEGHIVTNNHVVEGADSVRVKFSSGTVVDATILGRNPANDMALLKVPSLPVQGIQPLPLGNSSQLKPGQMAIAIGNPFGLEGSVTVGVISQVGRDLPTDLGRPISDVIQTDALINPGNSGGPLLDSSGAVVGINTAIQVSRTTRTSRGIGFAVPIDTLKTVLPRLKTEPIVSPPWLGIRASDIDAQLAERLGLSVDSGVYVVGVTPTSPADGVGLRESGVGSRGRPAAGGDIVTAVDGVNVNSTVDLIAQLNSNRPGDQVSLTVVRGAETLELVVTLGEWPDDSGDAIPERRFERRPRPDDRSSPWEHFRRFFPRLPGEESPQSLPRGLPHQLCPGK